MLATLLSEVENIKAKEPEFLSKWKTGRISYDVLSYIVTKGSLLAYLMSGSCVCRVSSQYDMNQQTGAIQDAGRRVVGISLVNGIF
jgi:hypothetical protein